MMTIPRSVIRAVRTVVRRAAVGRSRHVSPSIWFVPEPRAVLVRAGIGEGVIQYRVPTDSPGRDVVALTLADLERIEGPRDDRVTLELAGPQSARATWTDRGVPRALTLASVPNPPPTVAEPANWVAQPLAFLSALHEATRSTSREPARYALHRLQFQGRYGTVVGTDGRHATLYGGFAFPFAEDLLIPASPVFGTRDWHDAESVALGRTDTQIVLRAGLWTLALDIDRESRFPDVRGIIPRTATPTTLTISEADAQELLDRLASLPGAGDESQPVTLDLEPGQLGVIRAQGSDVELPVEWRLSSSRVENGPSRIALDRTWLQRAVTLGCRTVQVVGVGQPIVAGAGAITLVTIGLDASCRVAPSASVVPLDIPLSLPSTPMKILPGPAVSPVSSEPPEPLDPLAEAEALKAMLTDAANRASRLVQRLKQSRKQKRVLESAWTALQSLKLGATPAGV